MAKPLKIFLKGYWKRIQVTRSNYDYLDSDDNYTLYNIFNDTLNIFYSFRNDGVDKGFVLEHHLISNINYSSSSIKHHLLVWRNQW